MATKELADSTRGNYVKMWNSHVKANMARQGMNIKVLQYLMGHAHSDVTMDVYNHIAGREDVREEVER